MPDAAESFLEFIPTCNSTDETYECVRNGTLFSDYAQLKEAYDRGFGEVCRPGPSTSILSESSSCGMSVSHLSQEDEMFTDERVLHYTIDRILARGGGGLVLKATDTRNGNAMALKQVVYTPSLSRSAKTGPSEAACLAHLAHRNVLPVVEVIHGQCSTYIATPYMAAGPLGQLKMNNTCETVLSAKLWPYLRDIVSALRYAHSKGYYHKDVKPDNILIDSEDRAVLCDFHECERSESGCSTTPAGTLCFRPPETLALDHDDEYDLAAADVWSLGCTFYSALLGTAPFPDTGYGTTRRNILANTCVFPADCPALWSSVLSRMLDKNPQTRISLSELANMIVE